MLGRPWSFLKQLVANIKYFAQLRTRVPKYNELPQILTNRMCRKLNRKREAVEGTGRNGRKYNNAARDTFDRIYKTSIQSRG